MTAFRYAFASAFLAVAALQTAAAAPRGNDDFDICYRESGDEAIDACTRDKVVAPSATSRFVRAARPSSTVGPMYPTNGMNPVPVTE